MHMHLSKSDGPRINNPHNVQSDEDNCFNGKKNRNNSNHQISIDQILALYQQPKGSQSKRKKLSRRDLDLPLPPLPSEVHKYRKKHDNPFPSAFCTASIERNHSSSPVSTTKKYSRLSSPLNIVGANKAYHCDPRGVGTNCQPGGSYLQTSTNDISRDCGKQQKKKRTRPIKPLHLPPYPATGATSHPVVRPIPERRTAKVVRLSSRRSTVMPQVGTLDASRYSFLTEQSSDEPTIIAKTTPERPRVIGAKVSHRKVSLFNSNIERDLALQKELPPLPDKIVAPIKDEDIFLSEKPDNGTMSSERIPSSSLEMTTVRKLQTDDKTIKKFQKSPENMSGTIPNRASEGASLKIFSKTIDESEVEIPDRKLESSPAESKSPPPPLPKDKPTNHKRGRRSNNTKFNTINMDDSSKTSVPSKSPDAPDRPKSKEVNSSKELKIRPVSISSDKHILQFENSANYVFSDPGNDGDDSSVFTPVVPTSITTPRSPRSPAQSTDKETILLKKDMIASQTQDKVTGPAVQHAQPRNFRKEVSDLEYASEDNILERISVEEYNEVSRDATYESVIMALDQYEGIPSPDTNCKAPNNPQNNRALPVDLPKNERLVSPIPSSPMSTNSGTAIHKSNDTPRTSVSSGSLLHNQLKSSRIQSEVSAYSFESTDLITEGPEHQVTNNKLKSPLSPSIITSRADSLPGSSYVNRLRSK